jgi:hypothetical protein
MLLSEVAVSHKGWVVLRLALKLEAESRIRRP